MASINAYVNFDGNCAQAFDFYKSVFGGEFQARMTFGEAPGMDSPPEQKGKLMHVALPIGKHTVLMGSDWSTQMFGPMIRGNSFSLSIQAEERSEADKVFQGLSAGGKVTMPMSEAFWGAYFGMCTDRFGINWMVNCENRKA